MMQLNVHIHPEVEAALNANRPVVALESTLITHGFPYPDNLQIAQRMEKIVRDEGAVPATIAILKGMIVVGLTDDQLSFLAEAKHVRKCSIRDLPIVIVQKGDGATTVAATMSIAHQVGIAFLATGGIGGVHRGNRGDVSNDLIELSRTPITVVCAGMKAFLDLPATLEYLETQAVPVLGYGVRELPAFYSRSSGLMLDAQIDSCQTVAEVIYTRDELRLNNAILLTVPVPAEEEWPADEAQIAIEQALEEAECQNIVGRAMTPFLLNRIAVLSNGRSKAANKSLLANNARIGAQVAKAYYRLAMRDT